MSRVIHIVASIWIPFLLKAEYYFTVQRDHIWFIHCQAHAFLLPFCYYEWCFKNTGYYIFSSPMCPSSGYLPRRGIHMATPRLTFSGIVTLFSTVAIQFAFHRQYKGFGFSTFSQILAIFHCFNNRHFIRGWHRMRKRGEIRLRQRGIMRLNHWKEAFKSHENEDLCSEQPRNHHRNHHRVTGSYAGFLCSLN